MKYLAPPEVPSLSADPASAAAGALYRNTGSGLLRMYSGTAWADVGAAGASPASTVVAETAFGQASAVGTSSLFARADHTHGSPATPVTSLAAGTNITVSASTGSVTVSAPNAANVGGNNTFTGANTFAGSAVPSLTLSSTPQQLTGSNLTGASLQVWRDRVRFSAPTYETSPDGVTWTTVAGGGLGVFTGRSDQGVNIDNAARYVRWTWHDTNMSYSQIQRMLLKFGYVTPNPTVNVSYSSSADGVTWTSRASTSLSGASAQQWAFAVTDPGSDSYYQLQLQVVGGGTTGTVCHPVSVELQTARFGDQGSGLEREWPFNWYYDKSVTFLGQVNFLGNSKISSAGVFDNNNRVYSASNVPPYPVTSVAGRTGAVTLAAADVSGAMDLSTDQSAAGVKTFSGTAAVSGTLQPMGATGALQTMRAVTFAASTSAPASPQTNDLWVVTDVASASVVNSVAVGTGLSTSAASGSITLSQTSGYGMLAGGYAQITAATSTNANSSTPVDVTGLSVTVNVAANRRIRVSFQGMVMSSVASDRGVLNIREGSTILVTNQTFPLSVASSGFGVTASVVLTPTAGSHTYVISLSRQSGTGNINLIASSGTPAYILVEDIGPANGT